MSADVTVCDVNEQHEKRGQPSRLSAAPRRRRPRRRILGVVCLLALVAFGVWLLGSGEGANWFQGGDRPFAEIRILRDAPRFMFNSETPPSHEEAEAEFRRFRETQSKLIKSHFVLHAVLRNPEIAALTVVRREEAPLEWLEDALTVEISGEEFLRVSLRGVDGEDATRIINAVVDAYVSEVAMQDHTRLKSRLEDLRRVERERVDALRMQELNVRKFQERLGSTETQVDRERVQRLTRELHSRLASTKIKLEGARSELAHMSKQPQNDASASEAELEAALESDPVVAALLARRAVLSELLTDSGADETDETRARRQQLQQELDATSRAMEKRRTDAQPRIEQQLAAARNQTATAAREALAAKVQRLTAEKAACEEQLAQLRREASAQSRAGIDAHNLEVLQADIELQRGLLKLFRDEIVKLEIEIDKWQPRITLFQKAEVPAPR